MRSDRNAREFCIRLEISRGGEIGIDADDFPERLRQRQSEEPDSCVQVESGLAIGVRHHGFEQILNQKAIHLKERQMADTILIPTGLLHQVSRPAQFKLVFLLIQQQQALKLWK